MDEDQVRHIMQQVRSFPGMPATAARLMPLLQDPDAGTAQIEDILRYDPGLTANILKLTNSAYFGLPSHVSSVRQAVMLLGWKRLLQLVMTMCMSALMKTPVPGYDLPRGGLWRHSVAVSVASDLLVRELDIEDADEVFTAALLHDIGKLALGNFVQKDLDRIRDMVAKGISFEVAEYIVLGTNHADIGARILKKWSLPSELVNAVLWHHDPDHCATHCVLSDVVHAANVVGRRIANGAPAAGHALEPAPEVAERLGLTSSRLEAICGQAVGEMEKFSEILA
ncbi:MAG TPA: HDOD domain-containing protein [Desulfobacterales bacterium]|nr:HDOD domain-containing protein [Desulfobacterales bacterium]